LSDAHTTCWTLIRAAAAGNPAQREQFACRYQPAIIAYLAARWRGKPLLESLQDAVQEVFLACYRDDGALARVSPSAPGGFRAFLFGIVRHIALRFETRAAFETQRAAGQSALDAAPSGEDPLSRVFDRAWARSIMRDAAQLQADKAAVLGPEALRRVELLRLRFNECLPIRDIAQRWQVEPAKLHREYARARREFKSALLQVLGFYESTPELAEQECSRLLNMLA
jgi:RNA polymerase sigma-70 factor (ECF subfamily)